jgi:hypothetical protein
MCDSASIRAQLVEILGAEKGASVANEVIAHAIRMYFRHPDKSAEMRRLLEDDLPTQKKRGQPPKTARLRLGVDVALILRRHDVELARTSLAEDDTRRPGSRGGGKLDRVLKAVFAVVREDVPKHIFDVVLDTIKLEDAEAGLRRAIRANPPNRFFFD